MRIAQSALAILVPEAEALVGPLRQRFDPSAAAGVPAHITLLYPFLDPRQIDGTVIDSLAACFGAFAPIDFALTAIRRFPAEALYLQPDPEEPFRALTLAIWDRFPSAPPYGGKWPEIVPHLSVARLSDEPELNRIAAELGRAWERELPIRARAAGAVLIENASGRWTTLQTFRLGR
jgi:hypothetical protein